MKTLTESDQIRKKSLKQLQVIPGVGPSIAHDLWLLGIRKVEDLVTKDPETLYHESNQLVGQVQDRCLLYVFRCAVYFAQTPEPKRDLEMLKWWNWK